MDIIRLYQDYNIPFQTEGHKHCRPGWVNTPCPFCTGNPGLHLGYSLAGNYFRCWRCGFQKTLPTLSKLTLLPLNQLPSIIKQYEGHRRFIQQREPAIKLFPFKFPSNANPLTDNHKQYLTNRGFDPDKLVVDWGILGTGPISILGTGSNIQDYKHRVIIPIYWEGKPVSFQARAIAKNAQLKYKACPKIRESIHHKHILYGKQEKWGNTGICVEGIFDVWRFGFNAFATFGIDYTRIQRNVIMKTFKRVAVVFDDEPQAQLKAKKLVTDLKFYGVESFQILISGDPGAMKQKEADYLVKTIIGKS